MSNLIKSTAYVPLSAVKQLEFSVRPTDEEPDDVLPNAGGELERLKQIILEKTRRDAELITSGAKEEAARLLEQARKEADAWWEKRRSEDEAFRGKIQESAYREGLEQGRREAERQVREQYASYILEGRAVLEQAHEAARRIVAESEPFLVELACAIAGKIIGRKLEEKPEWVTELVRDALKRCTAKDTITLCVAPSQFAYMQSVREDLAAVIDSQAELMIVPDHSVHDHGCVIKTAYGTVDARVDTQLAEIRQALLDVCLREETHES